MTKNKKSPVKRDVVYRLSPKARQRKFIRELTKSVLAGVHQKIQAGKIPEQWDGNELRVLLADIFANEASWSAIKKYPRSKRAKAYKNFVLCNLWL
jgi:hypothetical protein